MGFPIFLGKNKEASAASSSEPVVRKPDNEPEYNGLHAAAEDLKSALASGDVPSIAAALQSAFDICNSQFDTDQEP